MLRKECSALNERVRFVFDLPVGEKITLFVR
jgi:hypothetical protein